MAIKLSICISTFNRGEFIGRTLESIIAQATEECEIVVVDGGSVDNTESVVTEFLGRFDRLRYAKQATNSGVDRDYNRAVELALGEYCWLFSDDDLMKPGAIESVLKALRDDFSLVLVNGEHRDFGMLSVCVPSFFDIESDRVYVPEEMNRLFAELGRCLVCICCVVIRRTVWIEREKERYFGSRFIHIGVIFQKQLPRKTLAMSTPFMSLRLGNEQTHAREAFQVWYINLPELVWSLPLSVSTKRDFCRPEPWKRLCYLLAIRGRAGYSLIDYERSIRPHLRSWREAFIPAFVVRLPHKLAYCLYVLCTLIAGKRVHASRSPWSTMLPESWNRYVDSLALMRDG